MCKRAVILLWAIMPATSVLADQATFDTPSDDRWHYPFNFTPGNRAILTLFSSVGNIVFPLFNDRDGKAIVGWDTTSQIEPGLCPQAYDIESMTVTITINTGAVWEIDLTTDEWFMFDFNNDGVINGDGIARGEPGDVDGESDDPDPGRPLELFGAGFGPLTSYASWTETSPYYGGTDQANNPSDPYPFVFHEGTFEMLHVEDSVKGTQNEDFGVFQFTPVTWAIGVPIDYTPGAQSVPFAVVFDVDLTLSDGAVRGYFQEQLSGGRTLVVLTTLLETVAMGGGPGTIPEIFSKEGLGLHEDARAPTLEVVYTIRPIGDVNNDCLANLMDHIALAECVNGPDVSPDPAPPLTIEACLAAFDFDGDGDVDMPDVGDFGLVFTGAP